MRKARIHVVYKNGVLDPEGQTIMQSLSSLGFQGIEDVRIGKYIEIDISSVDNSKKIAEDIKRMCEELLVNLVIENYEIELDDGNEE